jgi:hypothetical protein
MAGETSGSGGACHPVWRSRCGVSDSALAGLLGVGGTLVSQAGIMAPTRDLGTTVTAFVLTVTRAPLPDFPPPRA